MFKRGAAALVGVLIEAALLLVRPAIEEAEISLIRAAPVGAPVRE